MNIKEFDARVRAYCEEQQIMGVLRITHKDHVLYEARFGYADVKEQRPFGAWDMFTFYSLSKPFCAMGLLLLADRGLVELDAHPARYVKECGGLDARVTLRDLLYHSSGLPDFEQNADFCAKYAPGCYEKTREHLLALCDYPQLFAPGTRGMYANVNFVIQALIIENVSGCSYADYMRENVFRPLGMHTATVDREGLVIPHRVQGYTSKDGALVAVDKSLDWMLGAGDIVGTVDDVYCLNLAIKHERLLHHETWEQVLTRSEASHFGMGCRVSVWHGKRRITHNGGHAGFRTLHVQLPEDDFDVIFLSNSGFGNARDDIMDMIHDAFYGEDGTHEERMKMDEGYI